MPPRIGWRVSESELATGECNPQLKEAEIYGSLQHLDWRASLLRISRGDVRSRSQRMGISFEAVYIPSQLGHTRIIADIETTHQCHVLHKLGATVRSLVYVTALYMLHLLPCPRLVLRSLWRITRGTFGGVVEERESATGHIPASVGFT